MKTEKECLCGCGKICKNKYIWGHNRRNKIKTPKQKMNQSKGQLGRIAWNRGIAHTVEEKRKISKSTKQTISYMWQIPEYKRYMLESQFRRPTQPELFIDAILQLHTKKEWRYVGDGAFWIEGYNPDFVNCNGQKIIIEFDGKYWHKNKEKDLKRNSSYKKYGYKVICLDEEDLEESIILKKVGVLE